MNPQRVSDLPGGIEHARIRDMELRVERGCRIPRVKDVDAEELHAVAIGARRRGEEGRLEATRAAPRSPGVHHDRCAPELTEQLVEPGLVESGKPQRHCRK